MGRAPVGSGWSESFRGGGPAAERAEFAELTQTMLAARDLAVHSAGITSSGRPPARALHAKATLALDSAELRFVADLPADLCHGFAQPGASYPTLLRFSNAASVPAADGAPDLRGVAVRVQVSASSSHDLLMTNFPVSHARDARQFVEFALATAGGSVDRLRGLVRLLRLFGPGEVVRMLQNVMTARRHHPTSVFTETYWSRGAIRWGEHLAVRYLLRPEPGLPASSAADSTDATYLTSEAAQRLRAGPVVMELWIQRYRDPIMTPIEDAGVEWSEQGAPPERVAVLTIPQGDPTTPEAVTAAAAIEGLAFSPWNAPDTFRPLGNLNRARGPAYDASAAARGAVAGGSPARG